jgi:hypothetical protein
MRWGFKRHVVGKASSERPALVSEAARQPTGTLDEPALFAYLEESLAGNVETVPDPHSLVARALELANDDWSEKQAAAELIRIADGDRQALKQAYYQLQSTLLGPVVDLPGVRAGRVVHHALRQASGR